MRAVHLPAVALCVLFTVACGNSKGDDVGDDGDASPDAEECVGLACFQVDCPGGGTTSVSGTVYAPNGTLPLYGATVYVPNGTVQPFPEGVQCDRCGSTLSGNPLVKTTTDTEGKFRLDDMPATLSVPLVIQVGKWRRQITLGSVPQCTDTALDMTETRLPRRQAEGHPNDSIPRFALTTGGADSLECLLPKIGIDISEFGVAGEMDKRIHLYAGHATSAGGGTDKYDPTVDNGADFATAVSLWDDVADLSVYDVVLLSCEGSQNTGQKVDHLQKLKDYADIGGRVFGSHWHNYWIQNGPDPWADVGNWQFRNDLGNNIQATVNRSFPKGEDLADWLVTTGASTTNGTIELDDTQHTLESIDETAADKWIYLDTTSNGFPSVQYFSFTTPLEEAGDQRCGRVIFSDIHVSTGDNSQATYTFPSGGCITDVNSMSPQEKVLAFMLFDIASCVGPEVP